MADQNVQLIESEEDKKKKAAQSQPDSAFAGGATSPVGAPSATPSAGQQARAAQQAGPTKGTGFTGVGRYLQANVGSRLGEQVAGRVAQTGQQAQTRLGQSASQFGQQLGQQQQQLTAQQQAAQGALQRIAGKPSQSVELTPSQEEVAAYQAVAGGQYQAPTGLQDAEGIRSQAQLAAQLAKGTETTKGRMGLLQQVVGRGPQQYAKGKSALDALILGQSGGELAAARRASAGLERKLGTEERLAQEQARQFGSDIEKAKSELTGKVGELESPLVSGIERRKGEFLTSRSGAISDLRSALERGELTERQAEILGLTGPTQTYGLKGQELSNLLKSEINPSDVTSQAISSPEEAAKLNALYRLTGKQEFASKDQLEKAGSLSDFSKGLSLDRPALQRKKEEADTRIKQVSQDLESTLRGMPGWSSNQARDEFLAGLKKDESGKYDISSVNEKIQEANNAIENLKPRFNAGFGVGESFRRLADLLQQRVNALENYKTEYSSFYSPELKILPGPRAEMEKKSSKAPAYSATQPGIAQFGSKKK